MTAFSFIALRMVPGALLVVVAGCVSAPGPADIASTHPANANAAISPVPPLHTGLLPLTNVAVLQPALESAPAASHDHEGREAKPGAEEKK